MLKRVLIILLWATLTIGQLVPLSAYIGQRSHHCHFNHHGITGALVGTNIYTFGGCFAVPYIVNPDKEEDFMDSRTRRRMRESFTNPSDIGHVYDTLKDEWKVETTFPAPWRSSKTIVSNQSIHFHTIIKETYNRNTDSKMDFWKYDTISKEWSRLDDFPFLWHGQLCSAQHNGKIYFMGSAGQFRNIIHVYDSTLDQWLEDPIFLDKRLDVDSFLCHDQSIVIIGKEVAPRTKCTSNFQPWWQWSRKYKTSIYGVL